MKKKRSLFFAIVVTIFSIALIDLTIKYTSAQVPEALEEQNAYRQFRSVPIDLDTLRTGDLVLRTGTSFFSDEMRKFSQREAKYSHCGWVSRDENGELVVYHAIGGSDNPNNYLRRDKLAAFFNPAEISGFGIYRYNLTPGQIKKADDMAAQLYQKRVKFDMKFNLDDQEELYCAEFIYVLVTEATNNKNYLSLSQIKDKQYVGVDDLYLNENCVKIYEYEYN